MRDLQIHTAGGKKAFANKELNKAVLFLNRRP